MLVAVIFGVLALTAAGFAAPADRITPRTLPVPERTAWRPVGCRSVPVANPVLPPRTAFRRAHGDLESSDEVELAYAPVFARAWIAEPSLYQVTTPAFDDAGNLDMTPLLPHEPILMLSLDPETGRRRFVVPLRPGDRGGGAVPMVLRDPETGTEVVYVNAYDRVIALHTDGTPVWDAPTGLGGAVAADQSPVGLAWVPNADAVVGLTRDGFVFLLDRRTQSLPVRTGIVHVDRLTGTPRWFADGLEESLGAMSTGPDGALYLPHAPLRRAFALALGLTTEPLVGGVSKWASTRDDLLARDAACAAADRAANAVVQRAACPESARADLEQVVALRAQMLDAADHALADGHLGIATGRRLRRLAAKVRRPPVHQTASTIARYHRKASRALARACRLLSSGARGDVVFAAG